MPAQASRKARHKGAGWAALVGDLLAGFEAAQALKARAAKGRGGKAERGRKARAAKAHAAKSHRAEAAKARRRPAAPRHGRLEAIGWFLAAGVILAWPRRQALLDWRFLKRGEPAAAVAGHLSPMAAEAAEPGRGRSARHPGEIPLRGWKDILWRAWTEFNRDNIPQVAGGVTFFGLLAIFPAMAAFVSLYGLFFDVSKVQAQAQVLAGVLPSGALQLVQDQMTRLATAQHTGLSLAFVVSLALSLWSANAGAKALMVGLNISFEEKEKRNFFKLNAVSLCFTLGGLVFVLLAVAATVVAPIVLAFVGYQGSGLAILRWPLLLLVAVGALAVLYRYGPSRQKERWRWVSWGSTLAAILWLSASLIFSAYVAHFGNYDKTYGSLGAVVGFMTWIWISVITILFGAEINSEIEHQTAVDTTDGHPLPMGARGAHMADTLGKARPSNPAKAKAEADKPVAPHEAMSGA